MKEPGNWRKAKASFSNGNCIETASDSGVILVRDTADRDGPVARFPAQAWRVFTVRVKADE